jgi:hypothetical protein
MNKSPNLRAIFKNFASPLSLVCLVLLVSGCGKETLQDAVNQDIDRGNANSKVLNDRYQPSAGYYEGTGSFKSADPSKTGLVEAHLKLHVEVTPKTSPGSATAVPAITGYFTILTDDKDSSVVLAIQNGIYNNDRLEITVSGQGIDGPIVDCRNVRSGTLHCVWIPIGGSVEGFHFILHKTAASDNN